MTTGAGQLIWNDHAMPRPAKSVRNFARCAREHGAALDHSGRMSIVSRPSGPHEFPEMPSFTLTSTDGERRSYFTR